MRDNAHIKNEPSPEGINDLLSSISLSTDAMLRPCNAKWIGSFVAWSKSLSWGLKVLSIIVVLLVWEAFFLLGPKLKPNACVAFRATEGRDVFHLRDPSRDLGCNVKVG